MNSPFFHSYFSFVLSISKHQFIVLFIIEINTDSLKCRQKRDDIEAPCRAECGNFGVSVFDCNCNEIGSCDASVQQIVDVSYKCGHRTHLTGKCTSYKIQAFSEFFFTFDASRPINELLIIIINNKNEMVNARACDGIEVINALTVPSAATARMGVPYLYDRI